LGDLRQRLAGGEAAVDLATGDRKPALRRRMIRGRAAIRLLRQGFC
jgi:hypothetical protein